MTVTTQLFSLPKDGDIFTNLIFERCESLIDAGIWDGMDTIKINTWINNFKTPTERYFAACILDALIYRSNKQTIALMEHLFQRTLPDLTRLDPPQHGPADTWHDRLRTNSGSNPGIRIVPVLRASDPPSKSGPQLRECIDAIFP